MQRHAICTILDIGVDLIEHRLSRPTPNQKNVRAWPVGLTKIGQRLVVINRITADSSLVTFTSFQLCLVPKKDSFYGTNNQWLANPAGKPAGAHARYSPSVAEMNASLASHP